MQQNTIEWLENRKNHIGSSDAPIIMGVSPYKRSDGLHRTPHVLWKEKLGILLDEKPNEAMNYGKQMEEPARQAYEAYVNAKVPQAIIYHPTVLYLMASVDGLSKDKKYLVEIKNTNEKNHELAKEGKIPKEFFPQMQHQLECANKKYGIQCMHYWSFYNGSGALVEVPLEQKYIDSMLQEEEKFWDCVQNFKSPPLCDLDYISMEAGHEEATRLMEIKDLQSSLKREREKIEKKLQALCDGKNAIFGNVRYGFCMAKGNVKYSEIPELQNVNLDFYRGSPIKRWTPNFLK